MQLVIITDMQKLSENTAIISNISPLIAATVYASVG